MIVLKIEPLAFKTVKGLDAVVSGIAPRKKELTLCGAVQHQGIERRVEWTQAGEAEIVDGIQDLGRSGEFDLADKSGEVFLSEFNRLSDALCTG